MKAICEQPWQHINKWVSPTKFQELRITSQATENACVQWCQSSIWTICTLFKIATEKYYRKDNYSANSCKGRVALQDT